MAEQSQLGLYHSPYKFNGKELDEETGFYYYGARYYDPRISIWANVDPLAEKYPNVNPYVYCLNNPILFIDPDGKDIIFSEQKLKNGKTQITMTVTGKVVNDSSRKMTTEQLNAYANRMSEGIKSVYSIKDSKTIVEVVTNITVANSESDLTKTDTAFRIADADKIPNGEGGFEKDKPAGLGAYGSNVMYIAENILDNKLCTDGGVFGKMGLACNGDATLERTVAHELGHLGNENHPVTDNVVRPKNVMNQSNYKRDPGKKLDMDQLKRMKSSKLNNGLQKIEVRKG
jgi:RHS repeat-associated protein